MSLKHQSWTQLNINLGASGNKAVEVKFDNNNQPHILVRTTTTPFAEEGYYFPNATQTAFTHTAFPMVDGTVIPLKSLGFSGNNIPLAMTNLAVHDFENEGVYYFSDAPFLSVHQAEAAADMAVFPNPISDQVNVLMKDAIVSAKLVAVTGQVIPVMINDGKLDVSGIASGVYVLKISTGKQSYCRKLVVDASYWWW